MPPHGCMDTVRRDKGNCLENDRRLCSAEVEMVMIMALIITTVKKMRQTFQPSRRCFTRLLWKTPQR